MNILCHSVKLLAQVEGQYRQTVMTHNTHLMCQVLYRLNKLIFSLQLNCIYMRANPTAPGTTEAICKGLKRKWMRLAHILLEELCLVKLNA